MDAISDNISFFSKEQNWEAVFAEVNAWRGGCMHHFSMVEVAIADTLLILSITKPAGAAVRLRHLIGQRLEDLVAAIGPDGPFAEVGKHAFPQLLQYREKHETFRNLLCHGMIKVSIERSGQWILLIRTLVIRARQAERSIQVLEQAEAIEKIAELRRDVGKLVSMLGQLRKNVDVG